PFSIRTQFGFARGVAFARQREPLCRRDYAYQIGGVEIHLLKSAQQPEMPNRIPMPAHPNLRAVELEHERQPVQHRKNRTGKVEAAVSLIDDLDFIGSIAHSQDRSRGEQQVVAELKERSRRADKRRRRKQLDIAPDAFETGPACDDKLEL